MNITDVNNRVDTLCRDAQRDIAYYKFMHVVFTALSFISFALIFRSAVKYKVALQVGGAVGFYRMACSYLVKANQVKMTTAGKITQEYTQFIESKNSEELRNSGSSAGSCLRIGLFIAQWTTGLPWVSIIQNALTTYDKISAVIPRDEFEKMCKAECEKLIMECISEHAQGHIDGITSPHGYFLYTTQFTDISAIMSAKLKDQLATRVIAKLSFDQQKHDAVKNIVHEIIKNLTDAYRSWETV